MKRFILKSNRAYDSIKEPWGFLLLLLAVSPMVFISRENLTFSEISAGWTLLIVIWRVSGTLISDLEEYYKK